MSYFFASAQQTADFKVHEKNGKVYLEAVVTLDDVEAYITDIEYCDQGTSISFCMRNYMAEKLDISINGEPKLDFVIEASLANSKLLQINLSSEYSNPITSISITNNAFVDDIDNFQNKVKLTLGSETVEEVLDSQNRTATINL